jgi:hypothetical protein
MDVQLAVLSKLIEHLGSGNFLEDLKTINLGLMVSEDQVGLDAHQIRIRDAGGCSFVIGVSVKSE